MSETLSELGVRRRQLRLRFDLGEDALVLSEAATLLNSLEGYLVCSYWFFNTPDVRAERAAQQQLVLSRLRSQLSRVEMRILSEERKPFQPPTRSSRVSKARQRALQRQVLAAEGAYVNAVSARPPVRDYIIGLRVTRISYNSPLEILLDMSRMAPSLMAGAGVATLPFGVIKLLVAWQNYLTKSKEGKLERSILDLVTEQITTDAAGEAGASPADIDKAITVLRRLRSAEILAADGQVEKSSEDASDGS